MSFYELPAEGKDYFYFHLRDKVETTPHFHSAIELHFVKEGEINVIVDGEKRTLRAGDACFCDSFSVHSLSPLSHDRCFVLLGAKEYFEPIFSAFGNKTPPRFFRFERFQELEALYALCKENTQNEAGRYAIYSGAIEILLGLIAKNTPFAPRHQNTQSALVSDVLLYTEKHLFEDVSLSALAKVFGYSREHLSRLLHRQIGEHWNSYVNRQRARQAHLRLKKNADVSVLEIAYDCGFDSPNTFYRAYKKEYGKSPRNK